MPGQSLAMTQVAYNINNLWFAAHAGNWPLAQFYFGDARGRLRWALRITPVRKISTGDSSTASRRPSSRSSVRRSWPKT
jgi:hypothetical protein